MLTEPVNMVYCWKVAFIVNRFRLLLRFMSSSVPLHQISAQTEAAFQFLLTKNDAVNKLHVLFFSTHVPYIHTRLKRLKRK